MDPEVLAALVAAGAALLVSVISAFTVLVQTRVANRLQTRIAHEQDERTAARAASESYRAAIQDCCAAAQQFQDEIQLLVRGASGTLLSASARERVFAARDNVLQAYQRHHAVLAPADRSSFFLIREKTIETVIALEVAEAWSGRLLRISEEQTLELDRMIALMTQHQQRLWVAAVVSLPVALGHTDE
jgi:hypothetical protein